MSIIGLVSEDAEFAKRAHGLTTLFKTELNVFANADEFVDKAENQDFGIVILDSIHSPNANNTAGQVQAVKMGAPKAAIAVVVAKKVDIEAAAFIKKSGATAVMLENEYQDSSKIEFVVARVLQGEWIPIKVSDLIKDKPLRFTLNHMMPLHKKFLAIVAKNGVLDSTKLAKFETVGEFYLRKEELDGYREYAKENQDGSAEGLRRRCRAVYMSLVSAYQDLVMLLTDQSEGASFDKGRDLMVKLNAMASELMTNLASYGEPYEVINVSSVADSTAIDRAPAVAAYAGLLSLELDIGKPEEVMVAALLADIGLLDVPARALPALKLGNWAALTPEDLKVYQMHPITSVNKALARKVSLPDHLKQIIMCTHEQADEKGFPHRVNKEKIPLESSLIRFAESLDRISVLRMGEARMTPKEARAKVIEKEMNLATSNYPLDFGARVRSLLSQTGGPKQ